MKNLDKKFWNDRYINNETGWDLGNISTPIKEYIDQLTDKTIKILIPGCGNAHEAEYAFKKGFSNLFLLDLSPLALQNFKARVPDFPDDNLICNDFFNHNNSYDLIIEQTFFCAIDPKLRNQYAKHTAKLLNKNGKLVGLLFDDKLNDDKPPFGGSKSEYIKIFEPYFKLNKLEKAYNSIPPRKDRELFINISKK
ncbi:MAG: methyltransferase [Flavobacteriales bacterium]|nr:methyltransferase [Flavobacteriales bacterium]